MSPGRFHDAYRVQSRLGSGSPVHAEVHVPLFVLVLVDRLQLKVPEEPDQLNCSAKTAQHDLTAQKG